MSHASFDIEISNSQEVPIDSESIIELRDRCFPEIIDTEKYDINYWLWKHNPKANADQSHYLVARDKNSKRLAGFYAAIPLKYSTPSGPVTVGLVCDVMTSPDFQGRGVFYQLGLKSVATFLGGKFDTLTGYPIRENVLPGHRKVGWNFTEKLPVLISPAFRSFWFLLSLKARRTGYHTTACAPTEILNIEGFNEFYENWKNLAQQSNWSYLDIDHNFMSWRYSAPGVRYLCSVIRNSRNEIVGYAIGRRLKIGRFNYLVIGDMRSVEPATVPHLIMSLRSQTHNVIGIAGMFSSEVINHLRLKKSGFLTTPKKFLLIQFAQQMLDPSYDKDSTLISPYLTWSDTDDI